jgi:hypothetical protein
MHVLVTGSLLQDLEPFKGWQYGLFGYSWGSVHQPRVCSTKGSLTSCLYRLPGGMYREYLSPRTISDELKEPKARKFHDWPWFHTSTYNANYSGKTSFDGFGTFLLLSRLFSIRRRGLLQLIHFIREAGNEGNRDDDGGLDSYKATRKRIQRS